MSLSPKRDALHEVLSERLGRGQIDFLDHSFPEQCAFVNDPAKLKDLCCTRRAAKSYSGGIELYRDATETSACNCLYLALTKDNARNILWKDVMKDINRRKNVGATFNETRLTTTLPNESVIYLSGADADEEEMDKLLGRKYKKVVIDEGQAWHVDLRRLIYGILVPATTDYNGSVSLLGTAGNITQGLFYDITRQDGLPREPGWSHHSWTAYENPYVRDQWHKEIETIKRERPLFLETNLFKQWYLNQWVIDTNKLCYWYKEGRNDFTNLPHHPRGEWQYVLGVDLGYRPDPSSFGLVAFHENDRVLYGLESTKQLEMDVTDVANRIKHYQDRYPIFKVVIDGANKQAVEEIQRRHDVALTAADKRGKADFIEIMNAEFVQELIKINPLRCAPLKEEWQKLVWQTVADKIVIPRKEHPGLPNHCADGFLYAWRFCYQFLSKAEKPRINPNNREQFIAHTKKLMEEKLERDIQRQQAAESEEDFWAINSQGMDEDPLSHYMNKRRKR